MSFELIPANTVVVCNGRVIRAPTDGAHEDVSLSVPDLTALIESESGRAAPSLSYAKEDDDLLMILCSVMGIFSQKKSPLSAGQDPMAMLMINPPELSKNDDLVFQPPGSDGEDWAKPDIVLTVDPLALSTPKACAFALWMRTEFQARVTIAFYPRLDIAQLPPSSFHRWAPQGSAVFTNLPLDQLLTLKVSTPQSWIVYPREMGSRDPDNLLMSEGSLIAIYDIAHVVIDGHAVNVDQGGEPAAGMQLELLEFNGLSVPTPISDSSKRITDSIVMYNLGYWQLKARPGIYRVKPLPGYNFVKNQEQVIASFADYSGPGPIELRVHKELQEVAVEKGDEDDTMHVFSLASGALYERFLRIMMLSVRKRSSGKIKFWLLENYMSSPMKRFLPEFSRKNNFSYELVTFKWPDWLRGQSERQRQIWGMKILFLDVLFPLNVKRIIYVDSDQVLRADLRELWNMDLRGSPYAMTPFCDSRKETLGFQFWRHGYWASHLRGKNYHISALFVVDLVKFRTEAVGDRLRAVYQQLSADPNSLSNLDQDLPNFAQHDIPILSLPQEWLWCESWCSDSSKAQAKTIDLCNNPLHKEPKLGMAKRVIKGELFKESWEELDTEVGWPA
jgi:UDP-glucose:glycoprotein glucosyltransferase